MTLANQCERIVRLLAGGRGTAIGVSGFFFTWEMKMGSFGGSKKGAADQSARSRRQFRLDTELNAVLRGERTSGWWFTAHGGSKFEMNIEIWWV